VAQLFDRRKPDQAKSLARHDYDKGKRGGDGKEKSEKTEALAARKEILDQARHRKPNAKGCETGNRDAEYRAPAKSAPFGHDRRLECDRQWRGLAFRGDLNRASSRSACMVGLHHDHVGIVELESRRAPMVGAFAHCILSPIKNCSARSRRMCGSTAPLLPSLSSCGGRKRRKR
jgi:hypothetical protein